MQEAVGPRDQGLTSALLRQHVDRHVDLFRSATDPNVLLTALTSVTDTVIRNGPIDGFGLKQKLNACAFPKVVGSVRFAQPWSRTPKFDESVETLIQALFSATDEIAAFERRLAINRSLEIGQTRSLVLREVVELDRERLGDAIWLYDLEWKLGLSRYQAYDAVDFWHREGLLESEERPAAAANYSWRFVLSPYGRDDAVERLAAQPKARNNVAADSQLRARRRAE